jgi:hypothetical protein
MSDRLVDKGIAAAWVVLAAIVNYVTNFWYVLLSPESKAYGTLLYAAAVCIGLDVILLAYLLVYLPKCKGLTDSSAWEVYCPRVVPSMILVGVVCCLLLIRGVWPVFGFVSPLIIGTEVMGAVFALALMPWPF